MDTPEPIEEYIEIEAEGTFTCRCCGGHTFEKHTDNNGIYGPASRSWTIHYSCGSCSVHFDDPEKFSRTPYRAVKKVKNPEWEQQEKARFVRALREHMKPKPA